MRGGIIPSVPISLPFPFLFLKCWPPLVSFQFPPFWGMNAAREGMLDSMSTRDTNSTVGDGGHQICLTREASLSNIKEGRNVRETCALPLSLPLHLSSSPHLLSFVFSLCSSSLLSSSLFPLSLPLSRARPVSILCVSIV